MGLDGLHKAIDPGQLTSDLGGSYPYDHATWVELRRVRVASLTSSGMEVFGMCVWGGGRGGEVTTPIFLPTRNISDIFMQSYVVSPASFPAVLTILLPE